MLGKLCKMLVWAKTFWNVPRSTTTKGERRQMGLHEAKKAVHCKENIQPSEEAAGRMGENTCKLCNS